MKRDVPVIYYDGVCHFCNKWVQIILKNDNSNSIHFASLQSDKGQQVKQYLQSQGIDSDSIILFHNEKYYIESDAAVRVAKIMGLPFSIMSIFKFIPRFLRDGIYRWVARNRYRLFGKSEECLLPPPDHKKRFLD